MFTVLVAADLYGVKTNFELQFGVPPTYVEFKAKVEAVLSTECSLRRPHEVPVEPFVLQRMQVFDDRVALWIDLVSAAQLKDFCQVYVFQRETAFHREVQSKIPPPCKTVQVDTAGGALREMSPPVSVSVSPSPVVPAATPATVASSSPETACHAEKVRHTFGVMCGGAPSITMDAFSALFSKLRVGFPAEKTAELFEKADGNRDAVVSFAEYQRFAELYPTLLDSLFYRSKDEEAEERQRASIEVAQGQLENARARRADASAAVEEAVCDVSEQEAQVSTAESTVREAEYAERDAQALLDAAQQETQRVREDLGHRAQDVAQAKEKHRLAEASSSEATAELRRAEAGLRRQEEEHSRSEKRLAEIMELLRQQEEELESQRKAVEGAQQAVADAAGRESQARVEAEAQVQTVQRCHEALSVVEKELLDSQERQRARGVDHLSAREVVSKAAATKAEEDRKLLLLKEKEKVKRVLEADAEKEVGGQEQVVETLLAEHGELRGKRAQAEAEETPLLAEELRLRDQRDTLEQQEAALRTNHRSFHSNSGRHGIPSSSPARAHPSPGSPYSASPTF